MLQTCKKLSEGNWLVLVMVSAGKNTIITIRGSFRTRKCALADARRARKMYPGRFVDVVKRGDIPEHLKRMREFERTKACWHQKRKKACPCYG